VITSKWRWLRAGVPLAAIGILATVLVGLSMVTEQKRDAAVAKVRAMQPEALQKLTLERRTPRVATATKDAEAEKTPAAEAEPQGEDTIAAFAQLYEKKQALWNNPEWREASELLGSKPNEWTEADKRALAAFLEANRDLIAELVRLAELGGPVYELAFSKGFAIELPHLAELRQGARLLAADALMKAGGGNYADTVRELVAGMKLADTISGEPILISQLVRIAMDSIVCNAVAESIAGEDIPPNLIQDLIRYAGQAGRRDAFAASFAGEGWMGMDVFDRLRAGQLPAGTIDQPADPKDSILLDLYGSVLLRPWLNRDQEAYADIIARMHDASQLPYYDARPLLQEVNQDIESLPRTRVFSRKLLPALTRAVQSQAAHEARLDLMRVGLAVEQYHAQTGEYPSTLNAVAPILGGAIPIDPFTGQPYVYQPTAGGFRLRTGSTADPEGRPLSSGTDENGCLVWRY